VICHLYCNVSDVWLFRVELSDCMFGVDLAHSSRSGLFQAFGLHMKTATSSSTASLAHSLDGQSVLHAHILTDTVTPVGSKKSAELKVPHFTRFTA
jgi:hypothetical protein